MGSSQVPPERKSPDLMCQFSQSDMPISKLKNYGVDGNNLKWFQSYLNNRKQLIAYNNK